jgi:very-short-patch-repair endonuclease
LKKGRDFAFRRKYRLDGPECRKFAYSENSAFGVLPKKAMLLDEHFRCADGIAEYFNGEFYDGSLCLCCETGRTGNSTINGLKPGMEWVDAVGGDDAEIEAAIEYLKGLKKRRFPGTIGVISPLRNLVNRFKTRATDCKPSLPNQLEINSQVNTANGFQGGECDVILFLLGLNDNRKHGEEWYITSVENKYIYNVSVSRAKYLFIAFGDKRRVFVSGLSYIQKLIPETKSPRKVSIGPGEERLRVALERVGILTEPQYPVAGRYLDLAIPSHKIDIEVDGQAWHLDRNGCRKADDIHRDILMEALGWHVIRFWHYQVVNEIDVCINRVRESIGRFV